MNNYSQIKGMLAITKASFKAQLKSPMSLVFGFIFPLFFILIFGGGQADLPRTNIAFTEKSDTSNFFYGFVDTTDYFKKHNRITNYEAAKDSLLRGKLSAIYKIEQSTTDSAGYLIMIQPSKATKGNVGFLKMMTDAILFNIDKNAPSQFKQKFTVKILDPIGTREYKQIDKILPGQLGFSLLAAGLFGVSFLFFNLRDTLVLKRMNATPLKKPYILFGECLARVIYQLIIVTLIILMGYFFFGFTLVNGVYTFLSLLLLSFLGLVVFMGFGFIISGVAKSINTIPALTNLLGFPQFMLSGTFFDYKALPAFLHPVSKALPLTHLNDAMQKVSFEGLPLINALPQIGILSAWVVVLYSIAFRVFKWE
jgi:ABC-2 type transport system permease protein